MTCLTVFSIYSSIDWRLRGNPAGEQTGQLSADPQEKGFRRPLLGLLWWVQLCWLGPWKGLKKKKSESRFAWVLFPVCSRNVCIVKSWNIEACFSWRFLPAFPIWKTHTRYSHQHVVCPWSFLVNESLYQACNSLRDSVAFRTCGASEGHLSILKHWLASGVSLPLPKKCESLLILFFF